MEIDLKKLEDVDWAKLLDEVKARLVMSQREIAAYCDVSVQTVSAWRRNNTRLPDAHGRRGLLELARKAGITVCYGDEPAPTLSTAPQPQEDDKDEFNRLLDTMSDKDRKALLDEMRKRAGKR